MPPPTSLSDESDSGSSGSPQRRTRVRWLVFVLACIASFLLYLHRYTWGFVKPQLATRYGWSTETLGWLDSAFMVFYAAGQIPVGVLGDWFGPRSVTAGIVVLWSVAMGSTAWCVSFPQFVIVRSMFGLAQAGCYPNLNKITRVWFPFHERTGVQGLVSAFFGRLGGAASYVLFGGLMLGTLGLSWQQSLLWLMAAGLVFAVLFWLLFQNSPLEHPLVNPAELSYIAAENPAMVQAAAGSAIDWSLVFRNRSVLVLLFQQFTLAYVDMLFSTWLPMYLLQIKGVDLAQAGPLAALPLVGGALGGMSAGVAHNRLLSLTGSRRWTRSLTGLSGSLLAAVTLFLSLSLESATAMMAAFFVLKFFADWTQPTVWGTVTDLAGRNAASLFALVNTSGSLAGFVSGPTMGFVIRYFSTGTQPDAGGWTALFILVGTVYTLSGLAWLLIDCTRPVEELRAEPAARSE